MPGREYERWERYWREEPWGAHRDNKHAALIISELLKPHLTEAGRKAISIDDYMLRPVEDVQADSAAALIRSLELAEYMERREARLALRKAKKHQR